MGVNIANSHTSLSSREGVAVVGSDSSPANRSATGLRVRSPRNRNQYHPPPRATVTITQHHPTLQTLFSYNKYYNTTPPLTNTTNTTLLL